MTTSTAALTLAQHGAVSLVLLVTMAAMGAAALFFFARIPALLPRFQTAMLLLGIATAVSACGYAGQYAGWRASFRPAGAVAAATDVPLDALPWHVASALAMPALLLALVLVLNLPARKAWLHGGVLALVSAEMLLLAYPGRAGASPSDQWKALGLCLVPFAVLAAQLALLLRAMPLQPRASRPLLACVGCLTVAAWLARPALAALVTLGLDGPQAMAVAQAGGALLDLLAYGVCGLLIYTVADGRSRRRRAYIGDRRQPPGTVPYPSPLRELSA